jgi:hypothetical protein
MSFTLFLITGQGPCSAGIMSFGYKTREECEAEGRERIAKMAPVVTWRWSLLTGERLPDTEEPAEKHWRYHCIPESIT